MVPYTKLLKPLAILLVIGGIYFVGFKHAKSSTTAFYETQLKDQAEALNKQISDLNTKSNKIQLDLINKQNTLRGKNEEIQAELKKAIKSSTDECVNNRIPVDLTERL